MQARRIGSQHWLRIFSMICPSLPQEDYRRFSEEACQSIRVDRCEHVWAEPICPRIPGSSFFSSDDLSQIKTMRKKETFLGVIFRSNVWKKPTLAPRFHVRFIDFSAKI